MTSPLLASLSADGFLAPADEPYGATISDIRDTFVDSAPFAKERKEIFEVFEFFSKLIWRKWPKAILWVDGGFITHKTWEAPSDIDVAVLLPEEEYVDCTDDDIAPYSTLQNVFIPTGDAADPPAFIKRIQPFGGYIDSFIGPDNLPFRMIWADTWSKVKRRDGSLDPYARKGFLEVKNDG